MIWNQGNTYNWTSNTCPLEYDDEVAGKQTRTRRRAEKRFTRYACGNLAIGTKQLIALVL